MPRYLVRFSKTGSLRFISHLDTIELIKRALRRADLPVAYSKGQNPQMRLSILHPLPVGTESRAEYFNVELEKAILPDDLAKRLSDDLPPGIEIQSVRPVFRKLSFPMLEFIYRVELPADEPPAEDRIRAFLAQETIPLIRRKKGREREDDIRPYLKEIRREEKGLWMRVACLEGKSVRPEEIVELLMERAGGRAIPCRVLKLETAHGDR